MYRGIAWLLVSASMVAFGIDGSVDDSFFAAAGGSAEVDAGKLAQEKANSQAVKDFASATLPSVLAHLAKIKQIAASAGISTN